MPVAPPANPSGRQRAALPKCASELHPVWHTRSRRGVRPTLLHWSGRGGTHHRSSLQTFSDPPPPSIPAITPAARPSRCRCIPPWGGLLTPSAARLCRVAAERLWPCARLGAAGAATAGRCTDVCASRRGLHVALAPSWRRARRFRPRSALTTAAHAAIWAASKGTFACTCLGPPPRRPWLAEDRGGGGRGPPARSTVGGRAGGSVC